MTMVAHEIPRTIVISYAQRIEGEMVLETSCRDYDHFVSLPEVVAYDGIMCGKSGWNSDRGYACYKSSLLIARGVLQ